MTELYRRVVDDDNITRAWKERGAEVVTYERDLSAEADVRLAQAVRKAKAFLTIDGLYETGEEIRQMRQDPIGCVYRDIAYAIAAALAAEQQECGECAHWVARDYCDDLEHGDCMTVKALNIPARDKACPRFAARPAECGHAEQEGDDEN